MLLKRQYVAHVIRAIDNSIIQQVSSVDVILCMQYAGHKSKKWVSGRDLDHILNEGDNLYKPLNTFDMLSVDNLPRFIRLYDRMCKLNFYNLKER